MIWIVKTSLNCESPGPVLGKFVVIFVTFQLSCGPLDYFLDIGAGSNDS